MKYLALAVALSLPGCAQQSTTPVDANLTATEVVPLSPGVTPVRIGEGGPGFPACATRGSVVDLSPGGVRYLPLRAAPFVEAAEVAQLGNGMPLYLCSRSIDQKWQGVIVPPDDAPDADCGVAAPITAPRAYAGGCRSGWVAREFVRVGQ